MPFKVEATPEFLSESKKLSKKYPSLKNDIASLAVQLQQNPDLGTPLGKMPTKYDWQFLQKGKERAEEQE